MKTTVFRRLSAVLGALVALSGVATTARADILELGGKDFSTVTATVDFSYAKTNNTSGTLTITVTNTSSIAADLVGFAFNLPSGFSFSTIGGDANGAGPTALSSTNTGGVSGYGVDYNLDQIGANGFGQFDVGVLNSLTGNYINDGTGTGPQISAGQSRSFTLAVAGSGLNTLTTANFLSTLSSGTAANGAQPFVARAQRVGPNGASDFLRVVPLPPTLAMVLSGLLSLLAARFGLPCSMRLA